MAANEVEILNNRGLVFFNKGEYDLALDDFDEAIRIKPDYADALYNRGNTYLKKEDPDKAAKDFFETIKLAPNHDEAHNALGTLFFNKKDYVKAHEHYSLAVKIKPFNSIYKNNLGDTLIKMGEAELSDTAVTPSENVPIYQRFKNRLRAFNFKGEIKEIVETELEKLNGVTSIDPNTAVTQTYLNWIINLPWNEPEPEQLNLKQAKAILDEDHYGLQDVKTRILEFLAVRKMKGDTKGAILCLIGPPGVGKTSVTKSIARAMGREFFRFSVGGIHDESAIRGHSRTYIGASPGQIIKGLKNVKIKSPVCLIDEIDKIERGGFHGSPYSALLEVLDPEQNNTFRDTYLDLPFDLSHTLFVVTANEQNPLPGPLQDRMEIIELPGYIDTEKLAIAKHYLIPKSLEKNGLKADQVEYPDDAILHIANYEKEAGVRKLEQNLDKIHRKLVRQIIEAREDSTETIPNEKFVMDKTQVEKYLGRLYYFGEDEDIQKADRPGMALGLAVQGTQGVPLVIEAISFPGEEGFSITGNMAKVMKESAKIAIAFTRKLTIERYGIDPAWFSKNHINMHVPTGNPKDGNSAGITMATALVSLLRNKVITDKVVMTGELTLTGQVLKIGGLKEKIIGAKRNKAEHIVFPRQNLRDLDDIPDVVKEGIQFHPVERFEEVLTLALPD